MNWERIEGRWQQLKGHARSTWAKLTADDFKYIVREKDRLIGIIRERYGVLKDGAEKKADTWVTRFAPAKSESPRAAGEDNKPS